MRDKWHIKNNNKKGYLKIQVAVNVKTNNKILAMMKVNDEHVHNDIKALLGLVKDVIKSDNITPITIGKLFADDGAPTTVIWCF